PSPQPVYWLPSPSPDAEAPPRRTRRHHRNRRPLPECPPPSACTLSTRAAPVRTWPTRPATPCSSEESTTMRWLNTRLTTDRRLPSDRRTSTRWRLWVSISFVYPCRGVGSCRSRV